MRLDLCGGLRPFRPRRPVPSVNGDVAPLGNIMRDKLLTCAAAHRRCGVWVAGAAAALLVVWRLRNYYMYCVSEVVTCRTL